MQQMGDDDSRIERDLMNEKIRKREQLGKNIALFFPPLQVQLSMNSIAKTSLSDQMNFLNATTDFHEKLRLDFYPKIFENVSADTVNWDQYKPEYFKKIEVANIFKTSAPILIITLLLFGMSFIIGKKNF